MAKPDRLHRGPDTGKGADQDHARPANAPAAVANAASRLPPTTTSALPSCGYWFVPRIERAPPAHLADGWPPAKPAVTSIMVSALEPGAARPNLRAADFQLHEDGPRQHRSSRTDPPG